MKSAISVSTAEDIQVPVFKEHIVIPLIAIAVVLVVMNTMMFNLSLPQITKELALSTKVSAWTITGYSIVFAISSLTYSRLSDFLPIRLLIIIGVTSLGSASILGFFSNSFIMLLSARLIQALIAAINIGI